MRLIILAFSAAVSMASGALAKDCTPFEIEVAGLADEAAAFQKTAKFREYGFGRGGPFYGWLSRAQSTSEHPEVRDFVVKNDFVPINILSVAWEYQKHGSLDDFWQQTERSINALRRRC